MDKSGYWSIPTWRVWVGIILSWIGLAGVADGLIEWKDWFEVGWMEHWRLIRTFIIDNLLFWLPFRIPPIFIDLIVIWSITARSLIIVLSKFELPLKLKITLYSITMVIGPFTILALAILKQKAKAESKTLGNEALVASMKVSTALQIAQNERIIKRIRGEPDDGTEIDDFKAAEKKRNFDLLRDLVVASAPEVKIKNVIRKFYANVVLSGVGFVLILFVCSDLLKQL